VHFTRSCFAMKNYLIRQKWRFPVFLNLIDLWLNGSIFLVFQKCNGTSESTLISKKTIILNDHISLYVPQQTCLVHFSMGWWWNHGSKLVDQDIELVPSFLFTQVSRLSFSIVFFSEEIHCVLSWFFICNLKHTHNVSDCPAKQKPRHYLPCFISVSLLY